MVLTGLLGITLLLAGCRSTGIPTETAIISVQEMEKVHTNGRNEPSRQFDINSERAVCAWWSIQDGAGVLQIQLAAGKPHASTQAWLLNADGTAGKLSYRTDSPFSVTGGLGSTPYLMYEFTPDAASSAIAVVIQVEKEFCVFQIK